MCKTKNSITSNQNHSLIHEHCKIKLPYIRKTHNTQINYIISILHTVVKAKLFYWLLYFNSIYTQFTFIPLLNSFHFETIEGKYNTLYAVCDEFNTVIGVGIT